MKKRIGLLVAVFMIVSAFVSCNNLFPTSIGKILQNPRDYADKQVTVSGTVTDTFSLIFVKYFTLRDDTGEMVVVTHKPMPARGQKIKVRGMVQDAFSLGDQQMIVLVEDSGKAR